MTGVCLTVRFGPLARRLLLAIRLGAEGCCLFLPPLLMHSLLLLLLIHLALLLSRRALSRRWLYARFCCCRSCVQLPLFLVLLIDRRLLLPLLLLLDLLGFLLNLYFAARLAAGESPGCVDRLPPSYCPHHCVWLD